MQTLNHLIFEASKFGGFKRLMHWRCLNLVVSQFNLYLQKSIDFLLTRFFYIFRNDLYENSLFYMYTCCYTKHEIKV